MIDFILNIILSPEFILLGTFFRPGLGGKFTGKIGFANVVTNGIIQEDSNGITISTFFNQAVNLEEIAFGRGTNEGLTSSKFFRFDTVTSSITPRLIGPGMINSYVAGWSYNCNINFGIYDHSFIINGYCNSIAFDGINGTNSRADLIIGGYCGNVGGYPSVTSSYHNVIIDGKCAYLSGTRGNVIIGQGRSVQTSYNTIISSSDVFVKKPACFNSVISTNGTNITCSSTCFSSIISSNEPSIGDAPPFDDIGKFSFNSIISSHLSCVKSDHPDDLNNDFNSILSSKSSEIFGGSSFNTYTPKPSSCWNTIISTYRSCILDSKHSAILGGKYNKIKNYFNSSPSFGRNLLSSSIIGGCGNCVDNYFATTTKAINSKTSTVIGGQLNCIRLCGDCGSVILGGSCNYIFGGYGNIIGGYENTVLSGFGTIISSLNSVIQGSCCSSIISSNFESAFGKENTSISSYSLTGGLSYCSLRISNRKGFFYNNFGYHNSIIASKSTLKSVDEPILLSGGKSGKLFITYKLSSANPSLYSSCQSAIIGSCDSYMEYAKNSIILLSKDSSIYESAGSLISGVFNKVLCSCNSSIISSCQSYMIKALNSSIIGGSGNILGTSSLTTCNSVILGGSKMTLTFSNTVMTKHFNFECASIFTNATQYCNPRVGTFSNCFYCSLKVINGFIVS